jgi:hypothetical protein
MTDAEFDALFDWLTELMGPSLRWDGDVLHYGKMEWRLHQYGLGDLGFHDVHISQSAQGCGPKGWTRDQAKAAAEKYVSEMIGGSRG